MTENATAQPAAGTQPLLSVRHVSKTYGAVRALDDASLELASGEILGLCGHNGAGKSTLVKILTGQVHPDGGEIAMRDAPVELRDPLDAQSKGLAIVDQELALAPDLSVEENLFLGNFDLSLLRRPGAVRRRARDLLSRIGLAVDPRSPLEKLSIGERQLIEIARLVGRDARVLILDEPTATLSENEIERVFAVVRELVREGRSTIFVSHRLDEVLDLCDRVTVLRDGRIVASRSTADIAHRQELIKMMIGRELPPPQRSEAAGVAVGAGAAIAGLRVPPAVADFSLNVEGGQIVGLTGQIGSGTSQVLRALAGLEPDARGGFTLDGGAVRLGAPAAALRAGVAFASNDRKGEGLFLEKTVEDNLVATRLDSLSRLGFIRGGALRETARRLVDFVKVDGDRIGDTVEHFSGGNQQKIFLGRCLDREDVKLLLLDEPTRGVDVAGRAEIHQLIRQAALAGVAVLFASTELDEILDLSDRVVTMFGGRIVASLAREETNAALISADMTMSHERKEVAL
ncbi:MAG: sugar ABC transporter ATP-binding protein [Actinobacteria bacterium]|nr:sugar ABC transporter ATP-binding protein [Actinomycetota bacterium]